MTALAHSLKRIWSAKDRAPHQTGWGIRGSLWKENKETTLIRSAYESVLTLSGAAKQSAPTILLIVWNILR
ncbi:MAG: hypothetical protein LAP86_19905 [Acidobacteriia bacterium]|nr:hypothetical protein [Terriglobia bacterium]